MVDGVASTPAQDGHVTLVPAGHTYYVNPNAIAGHFTTAAGSDANAGKSADAPLASIQALLNFYTLKPGDSHFYDVHDIHSPNRETVTKLVRIEGANLDRIKRSHIKAA